MAEEWMSTLLYRGSIVLAGVVVALLSSPSADAQFEGLEPTGPSGGLGNNLVTGVQYDIVNKAKAERRLEALQAKRRCDAERGGSNNGNHAARRIDNLRYRIAVDDWLIRKNLQQDPGFYPLRTDPISAAAIIQAATPAPVSYPSEPVPAPKPTVAAPPTIAITIVNVEPAGSSVAFTIGGVAYQAAAASRQELAVPPGSNITYDGGGSIGQRQYQLSPGLYEFRSNDGAWSLYKLPDSP